MDIKSVVTNAYNEVKTDVTRLAKFASSKERLTNKQTHEVALRAFKMLSMVAMGVAVVSAIAALPVIATAAGVISLITAVALFVLSYDSYRVAGNIANDMNGGAVALSLGVGILSHAASEVKQKGIMGALNDAMEGNPAENGTAESILRGTIMKPVLKPILVQNPTLLANYVKLCASA